MGKDFLRTLRNVGLVALLSATPLLAQEPLLEQGNRQTETESNTKIDKELERIITEIKKDNLEAIGIKRGPFDFYYILRLVEQDETSEDPNYLNKQRIDPNPKNLEGKAAKLFSRLDEEGFNPKLRIRGDYIVEITEYGKMIQGEHDRLQERREEITKRLDEERLKLDKVAKRLDEGKIKLNQYQAALKAYHRSIDQANSQERSLKPRRLTQVDREMSARRFWEYNIVISFETDQSRKHRNEYKKHTEEMDKLREAIPDGAKIEYKGTIYHWEKYKGNSIDWLKGSFSYEYDEEFTTYYHGDTPSSTITQKSWAGVANIKFEEAILKEGKLIKKDKLIK